ncbi:DUF4232 domain-containing protein [Streptomyces sp. NPDC088729]|uniref:DUF4232 domain-containing protein n=1 Tax=Streptomyces sp. NPDC088729 TaxID=3365876 RepID=UPI0038164540
MSVIRNSRTRFLTAAATVTITALSLTACDDGTGTRSEGPADGSHSSRPSDAGSTASGSGGSGSGGSGSGGSGSGEAVPTAVVSDSAARTATCEGSTTKTVAAPLNRPVNHMLLTVTNTGTTSCFLYGYPALRFGQAQSVPPVIEASKPQAVVTLEPGESGYASVSLSSTDGSGSHGSTEKSLTVYFQGRSGNESVGKGANPSLPAKGVYIDDSLKVTYWQQSMGDAIDW